MRSLFIVTGEASGDRHASMVVRHLREQVPDLKVQGIGSVHLRSQGANLLFDSSRWSTMGIVQTVPRIPMFLRVFRKTCEAITSEPPDLLMLVDFGAFNVRLARWAKPRGIPILYYCPPRSWSRDPLRVRGLVGLIDCVATPFEWSAEFFNAAGGNAYFVGHPVLETSQPSASRVQLRKEFGARSDEMLLSILPGSRPFEVKALLTRLLQGAAELKRQLPRRPVRFILSLAPNLPESMIMGRRSWMDRLGIMTMRGRAGDILFASDFAWVASGTATLEAACAGTPMIIVYDAQYLSRIEGIIRRRSLIRVGLPNLIADRDIVPELLELDLTPARLVSETLRIIENSSVLLKTLDDLKSVRAQLGSGRASAHTAQLALHVAEQRMHRDMVVYGYQPETVTGV